MDLIKIDQNLFLLINSLAGKSSLFDSVAKFTVNEYFIPTTLSLALFSLWFNWGGVDKDLKQKGVLLGVFGVVIGSMGIVSTINALIQRPRPFEILETNLLFYKPTDPSFPSNAAVVAFALVAAIFLVDRKLGAAALILAAFYGFLRIFVGVHYPSDVIGGAVIGIGSVLIVNLFIFNSLLMIIIRFLRNLLKTIYLEEFS